jgi:transcriptional regulator with XRE-family HTH domain
MTISEQIKAVMDKEGVTAYRVSKDTGIDQASLSRFFSGGGMLLMESLIALLDYLGYDLTIRKKPSEKKQALT